MEKPAFIQKAFNWLVWNTRAIAPSIEHLQPSQRFMDLVTGLETASGKRVSVERANKLSVVWSCINVSSQSVASFPFSVKKRTIDGSFDQPDHPVYKLIKYKPNRFMTAMNFWQVVVWHILSRGNSFVYIEKNDRFQPVGMHILDPTKMQIQSYEGEIYYKYEGIDNPFLPEDLLHFKLYSQDGIVGISPILQNAETVGAHIKENEYRIKVLGEKPPGYLTEKYTGQGGHKGKNKADTNIENWKKGISENGIPYMYNDVQYVQLMIPPEEAQYLETRKLTKIDIMGIFRVPPEMLQMFENSNYSQSESTSINFGKYCLTPIVTCIEQELDCKIFGPQNFDSKEPFFTNADMRSIYRADMKTTGEYLQILQGSGTFNADDALRVLGMNPQPNGQGKKYYIQSAFMPKDQSEDFWASKSDSKKQDPKEVAKSLSSKELYQLYLDKVEGGEHE